MPERRRAMTTASSPDDSYIVDMARNLYGCDEIDIESGAEVSLAEGGAWVQGWFWVPDSKEEHDDSAEG